ncbi:DHHC2_3 [Blepharisma stoltei]|uniref:Palmitoyltransferase n=1 Tax=Blepharisma stoltei TaxID=1481888 RepID=A0AAU9INY2_9CILI|nr:unnamed protein product [Blepharisma stoltei]
MPINFRKSLGSIFILVLFAIITLIYYTFVIELYLPQYPSQKGILIGFHLILFMLLWSLFHVTFSEPGRVPPYWGFYMGDSEAKRKRYCLLCHVFKPERCHHCSVCNRCVLNMDHHCPWINNCVGFYNRKLFLLLLFYTLLCAYYVILFMTPTIFSSVKHLLQSSEIRVNLHPHLLYIGVYLFLLLLCFILTNFTKFHVKLVMKNSTTIESLDNTAVTGNYDLKSIRNWLQVFGRNPWLWVVPYYGKSGKPVGDGVMWSHDPFQDVLENDPVESETNREGAISRPPNSLSVVANSPSGRPSISDTSYEYTAEQNVNIGRLIEQHKERRTRSPFVSEIDTETSILHKSRAEISSLTPNTSVLEINMRDKQSA